ncbi:MAG: hypothetical protein ACYDHX_16830 [Methanothrix sp.]
MASCSPDEWHLDLMDFVVGIISASPVTDNGLKAGLGFKQESASRARGQAGVVARTGPLRRNAGGLSPSSSTAAAASSGRDWLTRLFGSPATLEAMFHSVSGAGRS